MAGKCCHEIGFCKHSTHKRAVLLSFALEFTESMLDIRIQSLLYGPPWLSSDKLFKIKVLRWLENVILRDRFCKYSVIGEPFC